MRRHANIIAAAACGLFLLSPPLARAAAPVPAPPGQASGVALQAGSLLDISKTDATAESTSPSAQASVVRVQGQPLLNLGGTQKGDGETGGALVDSGATLPAQVQVAPWHASARGSSGPNRQAASSAAVARADIPNAASVGVLTTQSKASYTEQQSSGTAVSEGVSLKLANAGQVTVLHSEVASEGRGHAYLLGVNDTHIGTDEQLGRSPLCALNAPSLLAVSCLTASGGAAAPAAGAIAGGTAEVARVAPAVPALNLLNPLVAISTAATSGRGGAGLLAASAASPVMAPAETSRSATQSPPAVQPAAQLPRTGADMVPSLVTAVAALLGGAGLRRFRRRPPAG